MHLCQKAKEDTMCAPAPRTPGGTSSLLWLASYSDGDWLEDRKRHSLNFPTEWVGLLGEEADTLFAHKHDKSRLRQQGQAVQCLCLIRNVGTVSDGSSFQHWDKLPKVLLEYFNWPLDGYGVY